MVAPIFCSTFLQEPLQLVQLAHLIDFDTSASIDLHKDDQIPILT